MIWPSRREAETGDPGQESPRILVHAFDGFLTAGSAPSLAAAQMASGHGTVVHRFDIDDYFDYRARRPMISYRADHYQDYDEPRLEIIMDRDSTGTPFLLLAGPEPDYRWERFIDEVEAVVRAHGVELTIGLGAVPMGVPHTRPAVITTHATRPELIDRTNMWTPDLRVPSSMQAVMEYRFGERGLDALGYVVHVPHYVAQVEFPPAAVALVNAVIDRTGLQLDTDRLRASEDATIADINAQIQEQDSGEVLSGLEQQYDAFARGAAQSLLADEADIPSGDELADQFERYLARQRKDGDD
jgi:hypothetical protein